MGKTYDRFLRSGIDLAPLGVARGDDEPYFCTPRGASIIGWEGTDGVHYCFVRGYGETVFAVSPMNAAPDFVHAVARDFSDFLRLLLSCGHAAAIEQCWAWSREQFDGYLAGNPPTGDALEAMARIREKLALEPMDDPWGYVHGLQDGFDYGKIKYSDPDCVPDAGSEPEGWAVRFAPRTKPGREVRLGVRFSWAGRDWLIPAAYICAQGLVLDICMRIELEDVSAFFDKWGTEEREFTPVEQRLIEAENPYSFDFTVCAVLNGRQLKMQHGSGAGWVLWRRDNPGMSRAFIEHYRLDASFGWSFHRLAFGWAAHRAPERIESLTLTLDDVPAGAPAEPFTVNAAGDTRVITNPATGAKHTLTVLEYEHKTFENSNEDFEYPAHCVSMRYMLDPDCDMELVDTAGSDAPRPKHRAAGGMSGSQVLMLRPGPDESKTALSSSHFEAAQSVSWLPIFKIKRYAPVDITLI